MLERNQVYCMDALELLRQLDEGSVDAVITDPPYGLGVESWDKPIDIAAFLEQVERVLAPAGFFAFTIQMPPMVDWLIALKMSALRYRDHIAWIKRKHTNPMAAMVKSHESLFVYSKGNAAYFQTEGKYTDVKLPGLMYDVVTIEALDRYIKDLHLAVKRGEKQVIRSNENSRHAAHERFGFSFSDRSSEMVNFTTVWSFLPESMSSLDGEHDHATQKPLKMFERLVELLSAQSATVVDPFAGSGTTLVAARNLGRDYIGADISPEYVELARKRLSLPYTLPMFEAVRS